MTRRFRDLPIAVKLTALMTGIALGSLLAGFALVTYMDARSSRAELEASASLLVRMYAEHCVADLAFGYREQATGTLGRLSLAEDVASAQIYDRDGRLFAQYDRPGGGAASAPPTIAGRASVPARSGTVDKCELMEYGGMTYGTICLQATMELKAARNAARARATALLAVGLSLAALLVSLLAQRLISRPLHALTEMARKVADEKNYSARSGVVRGDEIGSLAAGFDAMLAGLEQSNRERDAAAAALREAGLLLERRVAERTSELRMLNEELEAFTYSASHDLRAPIRRVDGFAALLEQECGVLNPSAADYLARIRKGCGLMSQVVDNLLTLSRVLRQDIARQRVDLTALVAEAAERLHESDRSRDTKIAISAGQFAEGDEGLLREVVENLMENAWKFTRKTRGGLIEFGSEQRAGEKVFFVRDNGRGFDMRFYGKLFHPFKRLHSPDEFPGTGVGLSTVRRIIERHGGRIWADSSEHRGATFYFTLSPAPPIQLPKP